VLIVKTPRMSWNYPCNDGSERGKRHVHSQREWAIEESDTDTGRIATFWCAVEEGGRREEGRDRGREGRWGGEFDTRGNKAKEQAGGQEGKALRHFGEQRQKLVLTRPLQFGSGHGVTC
jgi:hypothetical protein